MAPLDREYDDDDDDRLRRGTRRQRSDHRSLEDMDVRASVKPLEKTYEAVKKGMEDLGVAQIEREMEISEKIDKLMAEMQRKMKDDHKRDLMALEAQLRSHDDRLARLEDALARMERQLQEMMLKIQQGGGGGGRGCGAAIMGPAALGQALIQALMKGDFQSVQMLIAQGADPNSRDAQGNTPLHWAARMDCEPAVRLLLTAGACKSATDSQGRMPFHLASSNNVRGLLCC